jgi:hypothetical protein
VTTFTDGVAPSVTPEPAPDAEDGSGRRDAVEATQRRNAPDRSEWVHAEIQRRIATGGAASRGRHARREAVDSSGSVGYVPRHSVATPGPGAPRPRPVGGSGQPDRPPTAAPEAAKPETAKPEAAQPQAAPPPPTQPSELLRRERDSVGAPSRPVAWSRPPRPAETTSPPAPPPAARHPAQRTPSSAPPAPGARRPPPAGPPAPPATRTPPVEGDRPGPPADAATTDRVVAVPTTPGVPVVRPGAADDTRPSVDPQAGGSPSDEVLSGDPLFAANTPASAAPRRPSTTATRTPQRPLGVPEQRAAERSESTPEPGSEDAGPDLLQGRRVRVVLAERKGVARPVRTVIDIQEGTGVGALLRTNLIGSQLAVALRFAVGAALALGLLPLVFAMFPDIGRVELLGIRLPWLLLGGLVYPFLFTLGLWHSRTAERVEQNFADHVQD